MRITNNMLTSNFKNYISNNLNSLSKYQEMVSSGKKIKLPSDDPVISIKSSRLRTDLNEIKQYKKNCEDANSWMSLTEETVGQIGDYMQRARELTLQAANGTLETQDRQKIKSEISNLKQGIVDMLNTSYAGRYIFAGYRTNEKPFELVETDVGTKLTYQGKLINPLGSVSSSIDDVDFENFYNDNIDNIYGQAELVRANFKPFTATAPNLNFDIKINGTTHTIEFDNGVSYDEDNIVSELQNKIDASTIGPDKLKVSLDNGRLKLTATDNSINKIGIYESATDSIDLSTFGFADGSEAVANADQNIEYEVSVGTRMDINIEGNEILGKGSANLFELFNKLEMALDGEKTYKTGSYSGGTFTVEEKHLDLSNLVGDIDDCLFNILSARTDIGEKYKFSEMMINRIDNDILNFTELLSNNEDVDLAKAIIDMQTQENVYTASLQVGAKIIQPTLIDFLR